ncbi:MAG: 16S rRNA (cytosine(1402)-N(4))-methyltransferase RsmH, partial [Petrimonas sp.]
EYPVEKLSDIFFFYGELKTARKIASAVSTFRQSKKIDSITDFVEIMKPFTFREKENKTLAQAFQALRIEVNDELKALEEMLAQGLQMLKSGGRFSVISYHSLEDRLVKNFFRTGNFEGQIVKDFFGNVETPFELINRKVIIPTEEEQVSNPRSRSAKLRIAEKI